MHTCARYADTDTRDTAGNDRATRSESLPRLAACPPTKTIFTEEDEFRRGAAGPSLIFSKLALSLCHHNKKEEKKKARTTPPTSFEEGKRGMDVKGNH